MSEIQNDVSESVIQINLNNKKCEELWHQNNYSLALELAFDALKLSEKIYYPFGIADSCRNIGTIYSIQAKNLDAKVFLEKALHQYDLLDDQMGLIKCNTNLGIINGNLGNFQKALGFFFTAIDLCEKTNSKKLLSEQYLNVGSVYRKIGDLDNAYHHYKLSFKLKKQINDELGLGSVFNNIGNVFRQKKDSTLALGYFKRALIIWEKYKHKRGMATILNNISSLLIEKKEYDKAIDYIERQMAISLELNLNITFCMGYLQLATIYIQKDMFSVAWDYLENANNIILNIKDNELKIYHLYVLTDYYKKNKEYDKAIETQQKTISLKEEVFNDQLTHKIAEIETNFRIKQKEQENELYRLKNVELVNANKEIAQQKEELSKMNKKLLEMDKSKDSILRIVSHDLKNLIGSVYSVLDLLRFESLSPKSENYLNLIDNSVQKALKLVKDLLDANTIEMNDFSLDLAQVNIVEILKSFLYTFKMQTEKKNQTIILTLPDEEILVDLEIDRFWQMISNLVFNSIKFTKSFGKIDIILQKEDQLCVIIIKDNGIGIPQSLIPIIFEKFTKAKRKGTDGESTFGIGLSIVKKLTELHNGQITVDSIENEGSTFTIKLPIVYKNGGA